MKARHKSNMKLLSIVLKIQIYCRTVWKVKYVCMSMLDGSTVVLMLFLFCFFKKGGSWGLAVGPVIGFDDRGGGDLGFVLVSDGAVMVKQVVSVYYAA